MASFSYSAPAISDVEAEMEVAALTEEEKDQIEQDLRVGNSIEETDDLRESGIRNLGMELLKIPVDEKIDYLQALLRVPDLVEKETNSLKFLRGRQFDAKKAARCLVDYWTTRKELFGDKCFLPMKIDGAIHDDFETLHIGAIQLLPNDENGRSVMYCQPGLAIPSEVGIYSLLRCAFYLLQVASENTTTQAGGLVGICCMRGYGFKNFDRIHAKKSFRLIRECVPFELRAMHYPTPRLWAMPIQVALPVLKHLMGKKIRLRLVFYNDANSLQRYGLRTAGVPATIGGKLTFEYFYNWLNLQREKEASRETSCIAALC